jgi:hypothetical protein
MVAGCGAPTKSKPTHKVATMIVALLGMTPVRTFFATSEQHSGLLKVTLRTSQMKFGGSCWSATRHQNLSEPPRSRWPPDSLCAP